MVPRLPLTYSRHRAFKVVNICSVVTVMIIPILIIIVTIITIVIRFRASPLTPLPSHRHCYVSRLLLGQAGAQDSAHYQVMVMVIIMMVVIR